MSEPKNERNIVGREYDRVPQVRMMNDEYSITTGLMDKMNIQSHILERKLNFTDPNNVFLSGIVQLYRFLYQKSYIIARKYIIQTFSEAISFEINFRSTLGLYLNFIFTFDVPGPLIDNFNQLSERHQVSI